MKIRKILTLALILSLVSVLVLGCKKETATTTTKTLTATVQKGNITESITGTGNLAYSNVEKLAFEMAGYVEAVMVSAGDTVNKGQELVKLDTSVWDTQLKTLEKALVTAQRNLTTKERALVTAQRQVTTKELAVRQGELDLQTTENSLSNVSDVKTAQDAVDAIQLSINVAQANWLIAGAQGNDAAVAYYIQYIANLKQTLTQAQKNLQEIKSGISTSISSDIALQIAKIKLQIEQSKRSLEDAKLAIEDAKTAVSDAQLNVADAKQAVQDAQDALDESKSLSPIIKAPFDGFITKVNVVGGDDIQKGTVALQIADPNQFSANIVVTENDIFSVKVGGTATVSLDALSDLVFPATITKIAPTATISQGVVNYSVTIQLTSLQPITASRLPSQLPTGTIPSGTLPTGTTPSGTLPTGTRPTGTLPTGIRPTGALPTGTRPAGTLPTGTTPTTSSQSSDSTGQTSTNVATSQSVTLKDGLSATVNIISKLVTNVLIIPSKAITRKAQSYTLQVVSGTSTETRTVKIGMTDGTNTEITEGLNEGETVTYTVSSTSSSSSTNRNQQIVPGGSFEIRSGGF
jgi:multidrug efflux pump subunit AcrA (membrane-fusion protein)